jgi:hypothetical protein
MIQHSGSAVCCSADARCSRSPRPSVSRHLRRQEHRRLDGRDHAATTTHIVFDVKDNGRGPTMAETIRVDAAGLPTQWTITGTTTFGSKVPSISSGRANARMAGFHRQRGGASPRAPEPLRRAERQPLVGRPLRARLVEAPDGHRLPALPGGELDSDGGRDARRSGRRRPARAGHALRS